MVKLNELISHYSETIGSSPVKTTDNKLNLTWHNITYYTWEAEGKRVILQCRDLNINNKRFNGWAIQASHHVLVK